MRRLFQDAVHTFLRLLGIVDDTASQQFTISADAGQGRLQLMGSIVKEFLADLLLAFQLFQIMIDLIFHLFDRRSDLIELIILKCTKLQRRSLFLRFTDGPADLAQRTGHRTGRFAREDDGDEQCDRKGDSCHRQQRHRIAV